MSRVKKCSPEEISYRNQRRSVGLLGMALPFVLIIFNYVQGCEKIQPSISQYYYTYSGVLLVGVLSAVGLFLISYKGPQVIDDHVTNFAGVCAICVAFLPTAIDQNGGCILFNFQPNKIINTGHYIFAALFFLSLAVNSYFLFTRSDHKMITVQKDIRNTIYRACGILIVVFMVLIPISHLKVIEERLNFPLSTFMLEAFALFTFGTSWLIKGDTFVKDKAHPKMVAAKPSEVVPPNAK